MVKELCKDETTFFVCEVCRFVYQERELADKCQLWCERGSGNPEIAKHAVGVDHNGEISQLKRGVLPVSGAGQYSKMAFPRTILHFGANKPHGKDGVNQKSQGPVKKNWVRISLSEKGHEFYHYKSRKAEMIDKIVSRLSYEEREQLNSILQKLLNTTVKVLAMEQSKDLPSL